LTYAKSKNSIHGLIQVPAEEEGLGSKEETGDTRGIHEDNGPEGSRIA
jgi:hypothetical protein